AALPPSPPEYGQPAGLFAWMRNNLDYLSAHPLTQQNGAQIAALVAWTQREFERLAPLLAHRREQGWVRECHGDLHLGNIVLVGGEPLPFDCIEFNAELRHIDVMSEVAFTFMDLLRHGLQRLAWRFLSAYLEQCGDHPGMAVLTFFAVYRALVRAKVALIRAEQAQANGDFAAFEKPLALAERLTAMPSTAPLLVLTSGVSGSGKSTVAQELVETLGAVRIRSDVERKRLFGLTATERAGAEIYAPEATRRTYERLTAQARSVLQAGLHVIVDAACLLRHERDALRATASELGARFALLECTAPEPVLRERVAQRLAEHRDASDATVAVLETQLRVREPIAPEEGAHVLDTQSDRVALGVQALSYMQQHAP
ncbi:MAG: AAA family ATPase, partial [Burkholderiaceae bacterium]|nr:AAA family ATPase [Burkholderiaceae bacterium]